MKSKKRNKKKVDKKIKRSKYNKKTIKRKKFKGGTSTELNQMTGLSIIDDTDDTTGETGLHVKQSIIDRFDERNRRLESYIGSIMNDMRILHQNLLNVAHKISHALDLVRIVINTNREELSNDSWQHLKTIIIDAFDALKKIMDDSIINIFNIDDLDTIMDTIIEDIANDAHMLAQLIGDVNPDHENHVIKQKLTENREKVGDDARTAVLGINSVVTEEQDKLRAKHGLTSSVLSTEEYNLWKRMKRMADNLHSVEPRSKKQRLNQQSFFDAIKIFEKVLDDINKKVCITSGVMAYLRGIEEIESLTRRGEYNSERTPKNMMKDIVILINTLTKITEMGKYVMEEYLSVNDIKDLNTITVWMESNFISNIFNK